MEDCGVAPSTQTLNCVVEALAEGRQPDLILSLVQHMKSVRRVKLS
jgi:pentatricopeptide repeat protein